MNQPAEVVPAESKQLSIKDKILKSQKQYQSLLPAHISPQRFMRIIFTQMQANPKLGECTHESILASVLRAAEFGLVPNGRDGALVPFKTKVGNIWVMQAQFMPMYQGLMDMARNSGQISDIFPATVCENDEFEYELGFNRTFTHKPAIKDRGNPVAYYCVVEFKDGAKTFGPGPMTIADIEKIRNRSKAKDNGPWVTDYESMAWKTTIKRVLKFCPMSNELAEAIDADNTVEFDFIEGEYEQSEPVSSLDSQLMASKKPSPTYAQVADRIEKATTLDAVEQCLDVIKQVENEVQREELNKKAALRADKITVESNK